MLKPNTAWMNFYKRYTRSVFARDKERNRIFAEAQDVISALAKEKLQEAVEKATYKNGSMVLIDYTYLTRYASAAISAVRTEINRQYHRFASAAEKDVKHNFLGYRREAIITLKGLGIKVVVDKEILSEAKSEGLGVGVTFRGTPDKAFKQELTKQFTQGTSTGYKIKTLSQDHVAMLQKNTLEAISKGRGYGWSVDQMLDKIYPKDLDSAARATMGMQAERVVRTSHRDAVNSDLSKFLSMNNDVFYGARRTADGRPCCLCIMLDGEFIPLGETLDDHPNGMCIAVPLTYPEEYFATGKITEWPEVDVMGASLREMFYSMEAAEQRVVLGSSVFDLWQQEKFDLRAVINAETRVVKPYYRIVKELDDIGASSYPNCYFSSGTSTKINAVLDPMDRTLLGKDYVVVKDKGEVGKLLRQYGKDAANENGIEVFGTGSDILTNSTLDEATKARLCATYDLNNPLSMHWSTYNDYAREIGIFTRKAIDGSIYYLVPSEVVSSVGIGYGRIVKGIYKSVAKKAASKLVRPIAKLVKPVKAPKTKSASEALKQKYDKAKIVKKTTLHTGINGAQVQVSSTGEKFLYKKVSSIHEVLGELVYTDMAEKLDMDIVATTIRVGKNITVQEWQTLQIEVDVFGKYPEAENAVLKAMKEYITVTKEGSDWAMIDFLTGQGDRHSGNLMMAYDGKKVTAIKLIDNGVALMEDKYNASDVLRMVLDKGLSLNTKTVTSLKSYLTDMGWTERNTNWKLVTDNVRKSWGKLIGLSDDVIAAGHPNYAAVFTKRLRYLVDNKFKMQGELLGWRG